MKTRKTSGMQDEEHAYWRFDHENWLKEAQEWDVDIDMMESAISDLQTRLDAHKQRIQVHLQGIKAHDSATHEHEFNKERHEGVAYFKNIDDRRHELAAKGHYRAKADHESLKIRHYIIRGELQGLQRALKDD